jgi:membrane protein YqaA with SNARE-associated domain
MELSEEANKEEQNLAIEKDKIKGPFGFLKRLYNWVLSWAESKWAVPALFVLAFMESSFFPIPPDVLMIAMALSKSEKSLWYATVSTVGSVLGALFGYVIGYWFWYAVGDYFFAYIPGFTHELFDKVKQMYQENSSFIVFTSAFTPIPYKVFTITAGVSHVPLMPFVIASILGRGGRFYLVGLLFKFFGPKVKVFIDKYLNILTILLVVIYVLAFYLIPKIFGAK